MKVYLHIGNYKTGSTAIQSFLYHNRERFHELGYYIPSTGQNGVAHHDWAAALVGRSNAPDPDELYEDITNELNSSGFERAIVSTETFFNDAIAAELAERLSGHDLHVICYLRRQDHFASAFYMQLVKHPNFMECNLPNIEAFTRKEGPIDYVGVLDRWAAVVGEENMTVRPYEPEQLPDGVVDNFLSVFDLSADTFPKSAPTNPVNVTIETELIEFLRIANTLGLSENEHAMILRALEQISRRVRKTGMLHKRNVFSPQRRRQILETFQRDNNEIARRYLGRPNGILFVESPPEDDPTWEPMKLSVDALALILGIPWIFQQKELTEQLEHSNHEFNYQLVNFLQKKYLEKRRLAQSNADKQTRKRKYNTSDGQPTIPGIRSKLRFWAR